MSHTDKKAQFVAHVKTVLVCLQSAIRDSRRWNTACDSNEGRERDNPPSHLSCREVKTLIRNKKKAIFHSKTGGYNPNENALHQLPWHQQTTIFRLGTGHCRLNSISRGLAWRPPLSAPVESRAKHQNISAILLTLPPSKAADMVHLCVPENQVLGVCRGLVPDIQVCGTHGREDLVNITITSNAEEELLVTLSI